MARKQGLAALLVDRGLFDDAKSAAAWVMARKVRVANAYVTQPGARVPIDALVEVAGLDQRFVSRGGEKLEGALEAFGVRVDGLDVLDAGASTGGFTDCLLRHGARRVYAVDVGFGQLRGSIAADPRVVALERMNIGTLRPEHFETPPALCTADLSYLSLEKSLPILAPLLAPGARVVHLVKPLFEGVQPADARRASVLGETLARVSAYAPSAGLELSRWIASPILGSNGTVEFFAELVPKSGAPRTCSLEDEIAAALRQADAVAGGLEA